MVRLAAVCGAALLLAVACGSSGSQPAAHEDLPSPPPETATPAATPAATPVASGQAAPAQAPAQPQTAAPSVGHYWVCVPPQNTLPDGSWPQSSTMCARLFPNFEPRAGRAVQLAAFQISPTPAGDYWSCDPQSRTNQPVTDVFMSELAMAQNGLTPGQISAIEADPAANAPTYLKRPWSDPTGAAGAGVPLAAHKCGGA